MLSIAKLAKAGVVDPKTGKDRISYYEEHELRTLEKTLDYYYKAAQSAAAAGPVLTFGVSNGASQQQPIDPSAPVASTAPGQAAPNSAPNTAANSAANSANGLGLTADGKPAIELTRDAQGRPIAVNGRPLSVNFFHMDGAPLDAEIMPKWRGKAAATMGLKDPTDLQSLEQMFVHTRELSRGFVPGTNEQEHVNGAGDGHSMGLDLTFNAPKPVSLIAMFGSESVRAGVHDAHDRAVTRAMDILEEYVMTRLGTDGIDKTHVKGIVSAAFTHRASRELDPQLHTHVLLFNLIERLQAGKNGQRWGTFDGSPIFSLKMAIGALYRSELAKNLAELGFGIERSGPAHKLDEFTITGVDPEAIERGSKRAQQIATEMERTGRQGSEAKQKAAMATRRAKDEPAYPELRKMWRVMEGDYGMTPQSIEALRHAPEKALNRLRQAAEAAGPLSAEADELAVELARLDAAKAKPLIDWDEVFETATQMESTFFERDIFRLVAARTVGVWDAHRVVSEVREKMTQSHLVELTMDEFKRKRYTTQAMFNIEARLQDQIAEGLQSQTHRIPAEFVRRELAAFELRESRALGKPFALKEEQIEANLHCLCNTGDFAFVEGVAGAGKTTMVKAQRVVGEKAGFKFLGCATAGKAARVLAIDSGMETMTIAKLLVKLKHKSITLDNKTVLVIDEVGMVGSRALAKLLDHAKEAGAKIVGLGDTKQLQPVDAGAPIRSASNYYGDHIRIQLTEITRQKEAWMRDLVHRQMHANQRAYKIDGQGREINAAGEPTDHVGDKIALFAKPILTPEAAAKAQALEQATVDSYFAAQKENPNAPVKPRSATTPQIAERINAQIRAALRAQNRLSGPDFDLIVEHPPATPLSGVIDAQTFLAAKTKTLPLAVGERIRFTRAHAESLTPSNAAATIESLRWDEVAATPAAAATRSLRATVLLDTPAGQPARRVDIDLSRFPHIQHDYCRARAPRNDSKKAPLTNARVVVDELHAHDRLFIDRDQNKVDEKMVDDYLNATVELDPVKEPGKLTPVEPSEKLMLAGRNPEVMRLNNLARAKLKALGKVDPTDFPFYLNEKRTAWRDFSVGDRVAFTKPLKFKDPSKNAQVENGSLGEIKDLHYKGDALIATVVIDSVDKSSPGREVEVDLSTYKDLDLGYCVTTHKSQGTTVHKTFALLTEGMAQLEWVYVTLSRARYAAHAYAVGRDTSDFKPADWAKLSKETQAAVELEANLTILSQEFAKSGAKTSSIDHPSRDVESRPLGLVALREPYQPPHAALQKAVADTDPNAATQQAKANAAASKAQDSQASQSGTSQATGSGASAGGAPIQQPASAGSSTGSGAAVQAIRAAAAAFAGGQTPPGATPPAHQPAAQHFVPGRPLRIDDIIVLAQSNGRNSAEQADAQKQKPVLASFDALLSDAVAQRAQKSAEPAPQEAAPAKPANFTDLLAQAGAKKEQARKEESQRRAAREAELAAAAAIARQKEADIARKADEEAKRRAAAEAARKADEEAKRAEAARQAAAAKARARGRGRGAR